jgi:quinol monooxygenase YgiN
VSCQLYTDVEDDSRVVLLLEEWADVQSLRAHVRADSFRVVLSALEYACDRPEVQFDTVADSKGMEFITACRGCGKAEDQSE